MRYLLCLFCFIIFLILPSKNSTGQEVKETSLKNESSTVGVKEASSAVTVVAKEKEQKTAPEVSPVAKQPLVESRIVEVSFSKANEEPVQAISPAVVVTPQVDIEIKPVANITDSISKSQNVTLDFKEADIQNVLKIIAFKSGVNIVSTPDVIGNVTIRLEDVPWETAMDVILKTYGFGYQRQGNIILVTKLENISKIQAEEPLQTEIVVLKFLDAQDAQKILISLLSPRGKISVLYARGQKGWEFGTFKIGKETQEKSGIVREKESAQTETISIEKNAAGDLVSKKAEFQSSVKSKILVITDTASSLDRIRNVILPIIDKKPKQVLIETKLMEVNKNRLRDLGVDLGFGGSNNATQTAVGMGSFGKNAARDTTVAAGGHSLGSQFTPSVFNPKEGTTAVTGVQPYSLGAQLVFQKLTGTKLEAVIHALEEDTTTNTLSAPRILTLDNQEASILVGYHTPILTSSVSAATTTQGATLVQTLDYYQEIGIRLNVVPQINDEGFVNMIIHPSVTSSNSSITATNSAGGVTITTSYPIIDVREAQTQVLIKDGETVVIGGLLKDVKAKETIGVPFASKIPILGGLFRRDIYNTQKVDLLMFITAKLIKDGDYAPEELAQLEKGVDALAVEREAKANKSKKKVVNKK
ncbi:MAG: secretin and TonB N-terminal domain-containing protein [Candidatus Omnitrophica bacterium]|nr:secretin and TonB N-terminal domain-containing protein [Candidatus Omnitrophota bacterium]